MNPEVSPRYFIFIESNGEKSSILFKFLLFNIGVVHWLRYSGDRDQDCISKMGKGFGRVNIMQILCTHVCKWKNKELLKLFQEWREGYKGE
jgi:hypothetical protein